ncbi:MAG: FecR domain-containing protein [Solimonas sp.]
MSAADPPAPDAELLAEAADWLVCLQSGEASAEDRAAFERWRLRSPRHAAAWQRAEQVLGTFARVPSAAGGATLRRLPAMRRRQLLRMLAGAMIAGPAAWAATRRLPAWTADLRTATGEQKSLQLADGTRLVLNTASAVDVAFTAGERRLRLLAGEILVTTGRQDVSPQYRPFIVETPQGTVRALGTRFSVRRLDGDATRVAVFADAVEILTAGSGERRRLAAGEQTRFGRAGVDAAQPADPAAAAWEHGMLLVRGMRLADLAAELSRYRSGVIRCHPDVAGLVVSGAFPLRDTDASLRLLEQTLPLRIARHSRYWVTIEAAS